MKSFFMDLAKFNIKRNVNLKDYNSFKIESRAKVLIEVCSNEVVEVITVLKKHNKEFIILGAGSNTIFESKVVKKVVVVIKDRESIVLKKHCITCGAGESLSELCLYYLKNGFTGLEWACGIPASLGGAVCMNAGAFGGSMKSAVQSVVYFDGKDIKRIQCDSCAFGYRNSIFKEKGFIVLSVDLNYSVGNKEEIVDAVKNNLLVRKQKQPCLPSAGSVFKNGETFKAGELIESMNFKGKTVGGAMVSHKHANFIVNNGGATGKDVVKLIKEIKNLAKIKYNATLCEEVVIQ